MTRLKTFRNLSIFVVGSKLVDKFLDWGAKPIVARNIENTLEEREGHSALSKTIQFVRGLFDMIPDGFWYGAFTVLGVWAVLELTLIILRPKKRGSSNIAAQNSMQAVRPSPETLPTVASAATPVVSKRSADMKKVAVIDELYPLLHDLSEIHVDGLGNKFNVWREYFLGDRAPEHIQLMLDEIKIVVEQFQIIRKLLNRYKIYDDVYRMDNEIAVRINGIPEAIRPVTTLVEKLSRKFDQKSIELAEEGMRDVGISIGKLRLYLSNDCMKKLLEMRENEISRVG